MSDEKEDLELQALKRELDDAFATTRPRHGFEDELWLRMQARRPLWTRLRDAISSLGALFRQAPAVPLGAVAVLLVVVIGAGVLLTNGLGANRGGHGAFSQAGTHDLALGTAYGRLPTPALHPDLADQYPPGVGVSSGPTGPAFAQRSNLYFGAATLDWTGTFVTPSVRAPVLAYTEPGVPEADQFAASIGASSGKQSPQLNSPLGTLGTYQGGTFTVSVQGTVPQLPREPYYVLVPATPIQTAGNGGELLGAYSLLPQWPYAISVAVYSPGNQKVVYGRHYPLPDGTYADFINWYGEPDGIQINVLDHKAAVAIGQMPLDLTPANYPLITNDAALRAALTSAPSSTPSISPRPVVHLNQAVLVYALAVKNGQGFYEPAYLFSGTFSYNGQTYTKRVLVPLVDPALRS